jgi:hypothetical protein
LIRQRQFSILWRRRDPAQSALKPPAFAFPEGLKPERIRSNFPEQIFGILINWLPC